MSDIVFELVYIAGCLALTWLFYLLFGPANAGYIIVFLMLVKG